MVKKKPLVITNGKVSQLNELTEEILGAPDYHSGTSGVPSSEVEDIIALKQSVNFTEFLLDGDLNLEGDLWLA
jgi:hypothetical protein